jgi:hypothetical protein
MTDLTLPPFDAIVTREVRWFRSGPMPVSVTEWFASAVANTEREERTDWYDADFARDGVGMKRRGTSTIDVKFRVMGSDAVDIAPRMSGRIEDWLKTSTPVSESSDDRGHHHLEVAKSLVSRRYAIPAPAEPITGCEAELVSIAVASQRAWGLCFETFGRPEARFEAFDTGIRMFLADTPLPDGMAFTVDESCGYPDWIARLAQRA